MMGLSFAAVSLDLLQAQMVILELVVNRLLFKLIVQYREDLNFCDDQQNEKFTLL